MSPDHRWFVIVLLACVISVPRSLYAQERGDRLPVATVHVDVFGPFGEKIPNPEVRLFTSDHKRELAKGEQRLTIPEVPYGMYILRATSGALFGERELKVNTKETWVRIGLSFPGGERAVPLGDLIISGEISPPPPTAKNWWVRVEGVFLHTSREAALPGSGRFSVGGLEMGAYLVEVFEGSVLHHVETVEIDPKKLETHLTISIDPETRRLRE